MAVRILIPALLIAALVFGAPNLTSAVNRPIETLGIAEFNLVPSAAIQVAPNNASIHLLVTDATLPANTSFTVEVLRNDVCGAVGVSLTGPIGPFTTDNAGILNAAAAPALVALIDQSGTQNIAVRIIDGAGVTVRCGAVYTTRQGGAGRHWW